MNYYLEVLKKYAVFSGRATRSEYWYFQLFNLIIAIVLNAIDVVVGDKIGVGYGMGILALLYFLATFLPSLAVIIRRLHDVGKSGWMLLIEFIPIIGIIWLLILTIMPSEPKENKYGPSPRETTTAQSY